MGPTEVAYAGTRQAVSRLTYAADGWGVGEVWVANGRVVEVTHPIPANTPFRADETALAARLRRYLHGDRVSFDDVDLDVDWCTPFQHAVVEALRAVPYGETVTYGELAALAGYPGAQRAVGTFCARNRFALVVPCHRVVAADGIGKFGTLGIAYKRRLLELEGIPIATH